MEHAELADQINALKWPDGLSFTYKSDALSEVHILNYLLHRQIDLHSFQLENFYV